MKSLLLSLGLLLQLPLWSQSISADVKAKKYFDELVSSGKMIGVSAGYSLNNGEQTSFSSGFMNQEENIQANDNTVYRIASISKPFTAIAILQLYERGKLSLEEDISNYISYKIENNPSGITIKQLLHHTAGVPEYESTKESNSTIHYPTLQSAIDVFKDRELQSIPGKEFHYSTYGYVLLGAIIEQVSGQSYEEFLKENIFDPIGMSQTSVEKNGDNSKSKTALYHRNSRGKIKEATPTDLSNKIPGGGIQSTVGDLLLFGQAILNNALVAEETKNLMWTKANVNYSGNPYGLGFTLYGNNPKYGQVYGHSGTQMGASAQLMLLPQEDLVIIVLSNTSGAWQDVFKSTIALFDYCNEAKQ